MLEFIKSNKKKIALFLAAASVSGGKTQAMNVNIKNNLSRQQVVKNNYAKPLAITAAVLVPVIAIGIGLIYGLNRDKNEDDKKNNQKPDDKNKNQEGFVPEVVRRLESMGLGNWIPTFNTAIDRIKVYCPFGDGNFKERNSSFFEIIDAEKVEKEKIEVKPGEDRIYIYVHVNESLYYVLINKKDWCVTKYVDSEPNEGWGNLY